MRESTSPPRTPTPRSEVLTPTSPTGLNLLDSSDSRINYQQNSSATSSPLLETPPAMSHHNSNSHYSQSQQQSPPQIFSIDGGGNPSQLDLDFPKLTPPKSKSPRANNNYQNNNNINNSLDKSNASQASDSNKSAFNSTSESKTSSTSSNVNANLSQSQINTSNNNLNNINSSSSNNVNDANLALSISTSTASSQTQQNVTNNSVPLQQNYYERENRSRDNATSAGSNNSNAFQNDNSLQCESPTDTLNRGPGVLNGIGKKHRAGGGAKGTKPRLKQMGSSSSVEGGNNSSGFISRGNIHVLIELQNYYSSIFTYSSYLLVE